MEFNRKTIKKILFIILCGAVIFTAVQNFRFLWSFFCKAVSVISPVIAALCIAFVLNVFLGLLENKVFAFMSRSKKKFVRSMKRPLCIVLTYLVALGIVTLAILVVIPHILDTLAYIADKFPAFVGDAKEWIENLLNRFNIEQDSIPDIKINWTAASEKLKDWLYSYSDRLFGDALNITTSVFSAVFDGVLSIVISIYVLAQKEKISAFVKRLINTVFKPKAQKVIYNVSSKTNLYFSRFIAGQLTEALILGTLCFICMNILSFPNALIISVIIALTALVPVVGSIVGAVIGFLLIVITNPIKAVFFVLFIIILQQLEGNLIYPKVVGKVVGLPGILVVSSVLIGGNIGGVLGALLAVPTCAVLFTLLKEFIEKKERKNLSEQLIETVSESKTEE